MIVAINDNKERLVASKTERDGSRFRCPYCEGDVILKKGRKNIHHFAHTPESSCEFSGGESQIHLNIKTSIYNDLIKHPNVKACMIEAPLREYGVRPDVLFSMYNDKAVVVEIQKSDISVDLIEERMSKYRGINYYVIWVLVPVDKMTVNVKSWQKYLHGNSLGRVYYWESGATVKSCHYEADETYVEEYENYETGETVGGYYKTLKSRKVLRYSGHSLHLAEDFRVFNKDAYSNKHVNYPAANLWLDTNKKWW